MIIIIRALSQVRNNNNNKGPKNERKREKGQCYYPFTTVVLQSSTMIFMIESLLCCHFHILVRILVIELGLYIPMMGFLKLPQVFVSEQVGCTPTQFPLLSFHMLIALVHPLHGNPYSLTLISIDGHLHSPLIRLVDVRLCSSFLSSPQPPYSIPPIVLCPWLTLMYCVKIAKV